jgi:cathepsin X
LTALSPQVLVSCHMGGTCWGGNSIAVYQKLRYIGLPDESCSPYLGRNKEVYDLPECEPVDICKSCSGPAPGEDEEGQDNCKAVENYTKHYVKGYNIFSGADDIKKEIALFGPVSCGMKVTPNFQNYTSGIYEEYKFLPIVNHIVSIIGYDIDETTGTEYWIVKNSYGTYWGEDGFFRIRMHKNNLGIETYCSSGYPSYEKVDKEVAYSHQAQKSLNLQSILV